MPQSVFDYKRPSQVQGAAWTQELAIAPPGSLAAPLFAMYPSLGDTTIATATNLTTIEDGPSKVWRFGALTVNALLSFTKRARPQFILCDSLVMGAGGGMSMTGRGAAGASNWPIEDITIPQSVRLSAKYASQRAVIDYIKQNGIWIGDPVFWKFPDSEVGDCRATVTPGSVVLLSAAGCGKRTYGYSNGNAGTNGGTGSGGGGVGYGGGMGGSGRPWGGGPAGGSFGQHPTTGVGSAYSADDYGGPGGDGLLGTNGYACAAGTGNPGGTSNGGNPGNEGTGGTLVIICRGDVTRNATDLIQSNGVVGVNQVGLANGSMAGSGSGAGHISIIYGGSYIGTGNTQVNGGLGGTATVGTYPINGRAGGAGSFVLKTFAEMGWI